MSFFDTKEYKSFKQVFDRIQELDGNTWNNMEIYIKRFVRAADFAAINYNSVGWDAKTARFKWHPRPHLSRPMDY